MTPKDLVITPMGCRFLGRLIPCTIGRSGVTRDKREGDGATPVGIHRIVGASYRADRVAITCGAAPFPVKATRHGDIWSDDNADPAYNHGLHSPNHPWSHERMWRGDPLYDFVLMTDWNWPDAVPGKGSAIFIHRWRKPGHPTEGCVGFDPLTLQWIAGRLTARSRLIVLPH